MQVTISVNEIFGVSQIRTNLFYILGTWGDERAIIMEKKKEDLVFLSKILIDDLVFLLMQKIQQLQRRDFFIRQKDFHLMMNLMVSMYREMAVAVMRY